MSDADPTDGLDLDPVTRRRLMMATGGALGMGLVAGCTGEESGDGDGESLSRPTGGNINVGELDPVLEFLVLSADYQNKILEREYGDG